MSTKTTNRVTKTCASCGATYETAPSAKHCKRCGVKNALTGGPPIPSQSLPDLDIRGTAAEHADGSVSSHFEVGFRVGYAEAEAGELTYGIGEDGNPHPHDDPEQARSRNHWDNGYWAGVDKRGAEEELAKATAEAVKRQQEIAARHFWPEDKPLPTHHQMRRQHPCPKCRRVLTETGSQATVCTSVPGFVAYYRCRACAHRFKLPVSSPQE